MVSTATRLRGSWASMASRIESLIWSAILSGWPSVTDSEVKRRRDMSVLPGRWKKSAAGRSEPGPVARYPAGTQPWQWPVDAVLHRGPRRQQRRDRGPDARGHGVLRAARDLRGRSVGGEDDHGVLRSAEHLPGRHVVHHEQVAPLARQFRAGVGE